MVSEAKFKFIIDLINDILKSNKARVSYDGNIYQKNEDGQYVPITTIDIFLGMFLVKGHCGSLFIAEEIGCNIGRLKSLLQSPFQCLVRKYPKVYKPKNSSLQELALTVCKKVTSANCIKFEIC